MGGIFSSDCRSFGYILLKFIIHLIILWALRAHLLLFMVEDHRLWWGPHCKHWQHGNHVSFEGGHFLFKLSWDFGEWPILIFPGFDFSWVILWVSEGFSNSKYWPGYSGPECYNGHQWENNYWCTTFCTYDLLIRGTGPNYQMQFLRMCDIKFLSSRKLEYLP